MKPEEASLLEAIKKGAKDIEKKDAERQANASNSEPTAGDDPEVSKTVGGKPSVDFGANGEVRITGGAAGKPAPFTGGLKQTLD
jgi:hypothetical protein